MKKNGFTLIEVIVSMAILSIAMIPLISLFVSSIRLNDKSNQIITTRAQAESLMEKIKATPFSELSASGCVLEDYDVSTEIIVIDGHDYTKSIYQITDGDNIAVVTVTPTDYIWDVPEPTELPTDYYEVDLTDAGITRLETTVSIVEEDYINLSTGDYEKTIQVDNYTETGVARPLGNNNIVILYNATDTDSKIDVYNNVAGKTYNIYLVNYDINLENYDDSIVYNATTPTVNVVTGNIKLQDYTVPSYTTDDWQVSESSQRSPIVYHIEIDVTNKNSSFKIEGIKVTD